MRKRLSGALAFLTFVLMLLVIYADQIAPGLVKKFPGYRWKADVVIKAINGEKVHIYDIYSVQSRPDDRILHTVLIERGLTEKQINTFFHDDRFLYIQVKKD